MGAHSLCIKDMAGLLAPYTAYDLVKKLKTALHAEVTEKKDEIAEKTGVQQGSSLRPHGFSPSSLR